MIHQVEPLVMSSSVKRVCSQMETGFVGPGETVRKFEEKICEITNSKYCVSTNSGTSALLLGMNACGFIKGETILFPAYSFLAAANVAKFLNLNIELIDIKEDTLCMNPDLVIERMAACSGIIFVNHNGYCGEDRDLISDACDDSEVLMIEDSCQGIGIRDCGQKGLFGTFSFSVPKLVTTGQGGVLFTNDKNIYERSLQLRDQGGNWRKTRIHEHVGLNLKFNDILAAYGLDQLEKLDELLSIRNRIWNKYKQYLDIIDYGYDSSWGIIIRSDDPLTLISKLKESGISATQYYVPIYHNNYFYSHKEFPVTEKVYKSIVYLPSSLTLTGDDIEYICETVLKIEKEK